MKTAAVMTMKANGDGDKEEDGGHEEARATWGSVWTQLQPCWEYFSHRNWQVAPIRAFLLGRASELLHLERDGTPHSDDNPSLSHTDAGSRMDRAPVSTLGPNRQRPGPRHCQLSPSSRRSLHTALELRWPGRDSPCSPTRIPTVSLRGRPRPAPVAPLNPSCLPPVPPWGLPSSLCLPPCPHDQATSAEVRPPP